MKRYSTYQLLLISSLLAFFVKGITYAFIGSYLPLSLATLILLIFYFTKSNSKALNWVIIAWAISLICWSILRMFFGLIDHFVQPLTENHLLQELGIPGILISIFILYIGMYLFKKRKEITGHNIG